MPAIDTASPGTLTDNVSAWLFCPNDPVLRRQYHLYHAVGRRFHDYPLEDSFEVSRDELETLRNSPSPEEFQRLVREASKKGHVVGMLFAIIFIADKFSYSPPISMKKALYVIRKWGPGKQFGNGDPLPYTDRTLKNYWGQFRNVAHLWAAISINQSHPYCEEGTQLTENVESFLNVAAGLRRFGRTFVPPNSRGTPLLTSDAVQFSRDVQEGALSLREDSPGSISLKELLEDYTSVD